MNTADLTLQDPQQRANMAAYVAALRDPSLVQGQKRLTVVNETGRILAQCCLGVACEVALAHGLRLEVTAVPAISAGGFARRYNGEGGTLPPKVCDWLGVGSPDPALINAGGYSTTATRMNDSQGADFAQIADAFERTYLGPPGPQAVLQDLLDHSEPLTASRLIEHLAQRGWTLTRTGGAA